MQNKTGPYTLCGSEDCINNIQPQPNCAYFHRPRLTNVPSEESPERSSTADVSAVNFLSLYKYFLIQVATESAQ